MFAAEVEPTNLLIIPNAWVPVIIALVIPVLVAAVTHVTANNRVRTIVGFVFAAIVTILTQLTVSGGDAVITWETVRLFLLTAGTEIVAYMGWNGLTNGTLNAKVAPNVGVGKQPPA